ncbi:TetR/AcrR family transcriptional regulator [Microlunatus soli]|uniref:Regulatory protein, tetR family n=1 Tax=Microlunatus soli TaxID=630515 RepID=A0A1H1VRT7_9ACTN|nr:TetR family transcriptional regulator C-terminal domain-containing protein [Microlunatus soli]SDS87678.1 regulatory protein, tetR family [Microlunatus soli]
MPKIVDPTARRAEVVDATFAVIAESGFAAATLQQVADRAGINIGSVRHYFSGHGELLEFAMASMIERVSGRLQSHVDAVVTADQAQRAELTVKLLEELLPLDDRRRLEVAVWLEFSIAARTRPQLAELATKSAAGTRRLIGHVLSSMQQRGALRGDADITVETERLCSLIDGLSMGALLHPRTVPRTRVRAVLSAHLRQLRP